MLSDADLDAIIDRSRTAEVSLGKVQVSHYYHYYYCYYYYYYSYYYILPPHPLPSGMIPILK